MKRVKIVSVIIVLTILLSACGESNQTTTTMIKETEMPIMGLGNKIEGANFTGDAWMKMLSSEESYDCQVYNVTFAPAVRNNWHSHSVGQILLCTEGVGYYQEKGKPAQRLTVGDVVNIPADVVHWHGAAPDSRFTHIGITPKASENVAKWLEPVTDAEYAEAVGTDKPIQESRMANEDKSKLFDYVLGEAGMPVINESPLTMECVVEDIYETETFDNFICKIANTYAREDILDTNNKIDYSKLKPVLFEMPTYQYLRTGEVIGKCRTLGKNL